MSNNTLISPTDLRDYAKVRGWTLVPEAVKDRLFVLSHPRADFTQLIVPMDTTSPDYADAIRVAIERLSEFEQRGPKLVEASLLEAGSDTLRFGVTTVDSSEDGLPWNYVSWAVKGVETTLRAASCSEVQRRAFHPKMNRLEAQQLVESARLQHTEPGSFVLKVACPVDAIKEDGASLVDSKEPFVRRAILGISAAIRDLVAALEADTLEPLIENARLGESALSANLCDGLAAFKDENRKASLDFSVSWSARLPSPPPLFFSKVRIQWDYFSRIEQIGTDLRPYQPPKDQAYIGTVENMNGDVGPDGRRAGEVILDLLLSDGQSVKAKTVLNSDQYAIADQAHMTTGAYVVVKGLLHPGRQPRRLTDLSAFQLLPS